MKRIAAVLGAAAMLFSLAACAAGEADAGGPRLTGRVTAINGTQITLQLGEVQEIQPPDGDPPEGERTLPDGSRGQPPENGTPPGAEGQTPPEKPDGGGAGPMGTPPDGDLPEGERTLPEGSRGQPPGNGAPSSAERQTPPDGENGLGAFTASGETVTVDVAGASIRIASGTQAAGGYLADITEGAVLVIEMDGRQTVKAVTITQTGGPDEPAPPAASRTE